MQLDAHGNPEPIQLGDYRDVLAGVVCDALICDPPYGKRTHDSEPRRGDRYDGVEKLDGLRPQYTAWSESDVYSFVASWSPRVAGWIVALTSHDLIPVWQAAYEDAGRYAFAPVPCVIRGMSVRLGGDGPSSWAVYAMVSRPRSAAYSNWGTLDGAYIGPQRTSEAGGGRGKPDWLMRALVRDYSRPGHLIVDPVCGWGSTLIAALGLGRRALGSEIDPDAVLEARRRLARGTQTDLFSNATTQEI